MSELLWRLAARLADRDSLSNLHLFGFDLPTWWRLLRKNRFAVDPAYRRRAALGSLMSLSNSVQGFQERRAYAGLVASTNVEAPIFVLGHWRSGTSHLHRLLVQNPRFCSPLAYQVFRPHSFLNLEGEDLEDAAADLPTMSTADSIHAQIDAPEEDEFALLFTTGYSPHVASWFPRSSGYYERYISFRQVPEQHIAEWQDSLLWFLKKLTWKYKRPAVLKSPAHTARIRWLLKIFPKAKFVYIHRDPYSVFQSTYSLMDGNGRSRLQSVQSSPEQISSGVLRRYAMLYDAYIEQKSLIAEGNLCEVAFDDIEKDPLETLRSVYCQLRLPAFDEATPAVKAYLDSVKGHTKSSYPELSPALKARIASEWEAAFRTWGYPP